MMGEQDKQVVKEGWAGAELPCAIPGSSQGPAKGRRGWQQGSYLREHKAIIVRVSGIQGLVAHGMEKQDSHDLSGAAA